MKQLVISLPHPMLDFNVESQLSAWGEHFVGRHNVATQLFEADWHEVVYDDRIIFFAMARVGNYRFDVVGGVVDGNFVTCVMVCVGVRQNIDATDGAIGIKCRNTLNARNVDIGLGTRLESVPFNQRKLWQVPSA